MQKLMIWAPRWDQSTPNVLAICAICPPSSAVANNKARVFIVISHRCAGTGCINGLLLHQEQGIEHDRFREGNRQDGLDQDFC